MDCERALKARLIDLGFGMNRAFSADGFVIITDPGAAAPGSYEIRAYGAKHVRSAANGPAALSRPPEIDKKNDEKRG